jgi:predicted AlkP superfamily phosphohydrolase/phosphomutase
LEENTPVKPSRYWPGVLRAGLITGLVWGFLFGLELSGLGDLLPYPKDAFVFTVMVSLVSLVFWIVFFAVIGLVARLFLKSPKATISSGFLNGLGIFAIIFAQTMIFWIELNRPVSFSSIKIILGGLVLAGLSAVLTRRLVRLCTRIIQSSFVRNKAALRSRPLIWLAGYIVFLAVIMIVISLVVSHSAIRKEPLKNIVPSGKVLFIGVDAANWETLNPLLAAGRLPNFAKLINEGASGKLPSLVSMYNPFANTITMGIKSAAVWNSIFTGKSPAKHGIKDFIYTEIPGIAHPFRYPLLPSFTPSRAKVEKALGLKSRPYNRTLRKSKAIWNILTDARLEVGALGWWMTWPAEQINGDFLSDRFDDPDLPNRWIPDSLVTESQVDSLLMLTQNPAPQDLQYFTNYDYDPDFKTRWPKDSPEHIKNDLLSNLFKSYYQDRFRSRLGLRLMDQHDYSFLAVYFYGLDTAGHAFTRFKYPDLFPGVQPDEIAAFGQIIDKYYEWIDGEIGKYLAKIADNTTVVLCSDHGFGPWLGNRLAQKDVRLSGSHRKDGIVILWGKDIQAGVKIAPKNLLDILPTALYLLGLPVADDMDGSLITSAIEPSTLAIRPVAAINTYETERWQLKRVALTADQKVDEKTLQRLRGLGYLK